MTIVVSHGSGEVERTADRASLWVSYAELAADRSSAIGALRRRVPGVEARLERAGVEVRSRALVVRDEWREQRHAGCVAEQTYLLRIIEPEVLDRLLTALVDAEPSELRGPNWELADQSDAVLRAQRLAVDDARRRAEGFATALGRQLGDLVRLIDDAGARRAVSGYQVFAGSGQPAESLHLDPQPVTVSAGCTATWRLLP